MSSFVSAISRANDGHDLKSSRRFAVAEHAVIGGSMRGRRGRKKNLLGKSPVKNKIICVCGCALIGFGVASIHYGLSMVLIGVLLLIWCWVTEGGSQ